MACCVFQIYPYETLVVTHRGRCKLPPGVDRTRLEVRDAVLGSHFLSSFSVSQFFSVVALVSLVSQFDCLKSDLFARPSLTLELVYINFFRGGTGSSPPSLSVAEARLLHWRF